MGIICLNIVQLGFQEKFGEPDDTVHGCTDLMTHGGKELTLGPACRLCLLLCLQQISGALINPAFEMQTVLGQILIPMLNLFQHLIEAKDQLPDFIVEEALAEGRLVRILQDRERSPLTLSVLYPSRQHVPAKTRLFIDHMVEQFG